MMMEVSKDLSSELFDIGSSTSSFQKAMESQKQLFHNQIDQLRNIVVTQCNLTGVNPLSQEMAAGALSIKIGKRPRDLLNPKAVKYMQSVFSIKDGISKKESREISARFGVTVTQVREYFASQRTRVRKMVRLSREKAVIMSTSKEFQDILTTDSDPMLTIDIPLSSVGPSNADEAPCSNQYDVLPGLGEFEKQFVENIFSSMCKEETFCGQVKLMEWILQIGNPSVLCWFLTKGGVMILATWLSQAASEEQTSVLSVALKVLSYLPLHKALPVHMSTILQAINRLRFYRISDISNRARVLLSKWSKMFSKSQASRKPNGIKSAGAPEIDLRQRIGELIEDESWQSSVNNPDILIAPLDGDTDDCRKMETPKLLTASSDDSNKKHVLGSSTTYNKERRKVLLVEQPGHKTAGKSQQVKAVPSGASQARPITADEIQKAKMRAQFIQSNKMKCEGPKKSSLLTNDLLSASEAYLRPKLEAQKKARLIPPKNSILLGSSSDQKPIFHEGSLLDKCRRVQIPWRAPPEIQVHADWEIGMGQNSKEIESQRNRMHREKETIYRTLHEVPPNPKEPWDVEMDFDDTLTPGIPIDPLPDADGVDAPLDTQVSGNQNLSVATPNIPSNSSQAGNGISEAEPDLELLAVLLKNPELVFALTSGQASGLSSADTVKLLDMLKSSAGAGMFNGLAKKAEEKVVEVSLPSPTPTRHVEVSLPSPTPSSRFEVSLPSPTPSSNLGLSGWASEAARNPFSRSTMAPLPGATATVTASDRFQNTSILQSQLPSSAPTIPPLLQTFSSPSSSSAKPENHLTFFPSASTQTSSNSNLPVNSSLHSERVPSNISPYHRSSLGLSQPQLCSQQHYQSVSEPYLPVPDDSNRAMLKATHGLAHISFSTNGDQNVYNPIGRPESLARVGSGVFLGSSWERNELYPSGRKGFESLSPQKSPVGYQPEQQSHGYRHGHGHGHGHGWNYQDQRGYHGHPPDRVSRYQNSLGYWDRSWRGGSGSGSSGGGGSRRWHDDDRRR